LRLLAISLAGWLAVCFWRTNRQSVWDGEHNFNFVVRGERVYIFSYQPADEVLNIISLPSDLFLPVAKGYGNYKLENIPQLGELEKMEAGELLRMSLQNFLAVPIDGFIFFNNCRPGEIEDQKFSLCLIGQKCRTNLSWWDLLRFKFRQNRLKLNQIRTLAIEEECLLKKEKLADGSEIFSLETSLIDDFSQRYFSEKDILTAGLKITVANESSAVGLAKKAGRLLKNIGAEIVINEKTDQHSLQSLLYYREKAYQKSYSFQKMVQVFGVKETIFDPQMRADLNLVLGEDFSQFFYQH